MPSPAISDGWLYENSQNDHTLYAFALDGGNNAVYRRRHTAAPAVSSLRRLTPVH